MTTSGNMPAPGDVIAAKYRVERLLGVGGMGAVFEVTHQVTRKRFAIKWLLPELCGSEEASLRFIREAQLVGRFDHRNVVQVYDLGKEGSTSYMVMELLEGEPLSGRLKRLGRLSASETCDVLLPCMQALATAHAVGIIHRDIKPANIFLCRGEGAETETPKLLDFGIAKLMPGQVPADAMRTATGAIMGTPHYMAPEQMLGHAIDQRVDVYALGVTLYEMLSGRRPFEGNTYAELVLKVTGGQLEPLEGRIPQLPEGLSDVVLKAMARDPDARFPSVVSMMSELARYERPASRPITLPTLQGTPTHIELQAPTPLASESVSTMPMRRGGRTWLLAIAVVVAAGVTMALWRVAGLSQWVSQLVDAADKTDIAAAADPPAEVPVMAGERAQQETGDGWIELPSVTGTAAAGGVSTEALVPSGLAVPEEPLEQQPESPLTAADADRSRQAAPLEARPRAVTSAAPAQSAPLAPPTLPFEAAPADDALRSTPGLGRQGQKQPVKPLVPRPNVGLDSSDFLLEREPPASGERPATRLDRGDFL